MAPQQPPGLPETQRSVPRRWALPALAALLVSAGLLPWLLALRPGWSRAA